MSQLQRQPRHNGRRRDLVPWAAILVRAGGPRDHERYGIVAQGDQVLPDELWRLESGQEAAAGRDSGAQGWIE